MSHLNNDCNHYDSNYEQVEGHQEFIIEAADVSEMRCWLIAIQAGGTSSSALSLSSSSALGVRQGRLTIWT